MNELPAQDSGMLKRVGQQALSWDSETTLRLSDTDSRSIRSKAGFSSTSNSDGRVRKYGG